MISQRQHTGMKTIKLSLAELGAMMIGSSLHKLSMSGFDLWFLSAVLLSTPAHRQAKPLTSCDRWTDFSMYMWCGSLSTYTHFRKGIGKDIREKLID